MGAGLLGGGVAGERSELQQQRRRRGGGAVQVAVGDDGAFVGAAGAAVGGVQVLDERPAARRCEALAWGFSTRATVANLPDGTTQMAIFWHLRPSPKTPRTVSWPAFAISGMHTINRADAWPVPMSSNETR